MGSRNHELSSLFVVVVVVVIVVVTVVIVGFVANRNLVLSTLFMNGLDSAVQVLSRMTMEWLRDCALCVWMSKIDA